MKLNHFYRTVALWCVVFFAFAPIIHAQNAPVSKHTGVPQDWSQRHIVFSRDALAQHPELIYREPRILHQAMQRWQAPKPDALRVKKSPPPPMKEPGLERDWNYSLPGRLVPNMYPAKFSFDASAPPDCTKDYVVFGLARPGTTGGAANLVAFNNLYVNSLGTGFCPGTAPKVLFAYNITTVPGGRIRTSPILSLDGTQIAFVESAPATVGPPATPAQAIFHVLTWTAGGTPTDSAPPPLPPTMTSLTLSASVSDTTSSPWIDYFRDIVYVGLDDGTVHKLTGVFNGTPVESGPPWPVTVRSGFRLTAPVLDSILGQLMVGNGYGSLYKIDTSSGAVSSLVVGPPLVTGAGVFAAPIVDITNGTTFAVSSNDGVQGGVLLEADTASLTPLSTANIGVGSFRGTVVRLYEPQFDNNYYNDPSTGTIQLCGTGLVTDTSPWQYVFGFTVTPPSTQPIMNTAPATGFPLQLSTSTTDRCTGWTEFFNPNAGAADTITATAVASDVLTVTANNTDLTVGEEVFIQGKQEPSLNGQTLIVTSLIGPASNYTGFTASFATGDYPTAPDTGTVSPADTITATSVTSNILTVTATNSNLTVGENVSIQGTAEPLVNGHTVTVASLLGSAPPYTGFTASFTTPDYSNPSDTGTVYAVSAGTDFFFFGLTGDCTGVGGTATTGCVVVLANSAGATTTTTAAVTGGPSGIVVDNYSTGAQASSIYLMANHVNTAYKFTQNGLQ